MTILTIYGAYATGVGWTNPSRAAGAADSTFATWVSSTHNATSSNLVITFAAQEIPLDATINMVTVVLKGYVSNVSLFDYLQSELKSLDGLSLSTVQNHTLTTTSTNVWLAYPATVTTDDLYNGVVLKVRADRKNTTSASTVYIDSAKISIDYTENAVPKEGSLTASYNFTGSLTGSAPAVSPNEGSLTATYEFTGLISGLAPYFGSIAGSHNWSGSLTGETPIIEPNEGSLTATYEFTGLISGLAPYLGSIAGSHNFTGSLTGSAPAVSPNEGTVVGVHIWNVELFGSRQLSGAVQSGVSEWTGSLEGSSPNRGLIEGFTVWTAALSGSSPNSGSITATHNWSAILFGSALGGGSLLATHTWSGSVEGLRDSLGTFAANVLWQASLDGSRESSGYISAEYDFAASALSGYTTMHGSFEADIVWSSLLYGRSKLGRRGALLVGTM